MYVGWGGLLTGCGVGHTPQETAGIAWTLRKGDCSVGAEFSAAATDRYMETSFWPVLRPVPGLGDGQRPQCGHRLVPRSQGSGTTAAPVWAPPGPRDQGRTAVRRGSSSEAQTRPRRADPILGVFIFLSVAPGRRPGKGFDPELPEHTGPPSPLWTADGKASARALLVPPLKTRAVISASPRCHLPVNVGHGSAARGRWPRPPCPHAG